MTTKYIFTEAEKAHLTQLVAASVENARQLFGFTKTVTVDFSLAGRAAGYAHWNLRADTFKVRLNAQAYQKDPYHIATDTIPHEVAHLVCAALGLGRGHNAGWKRVAIALGSKGERCHRLKLEPARKTTRHAYVVPSGHEVQVSTLIHNKIQLGNNRRLVKTGETIAACHYRGAV